MQSSTLLCPRRSSLHPSLRILQSKREIGRASRRVLFLLCAVTSDIKNRLVRNIMKLHRNKTFQAALARHVNRSKQLPVDAPSSPVVATKSGAASHSLIQRTQTPPASSQARVVESAAQLPRPLNQATPAMPHPPLATFSSSAHFTTSNEPAAKRPCIELMSSPQERRRERMHTVDLERNTPATDCKTPSTQMRPSNLPLQSVQDPSYRSSLHASPRPSQSSLRQNMSSAVQTHSPPTPPRHLSRVSTLASSVRSSPIQYQHSPPNRRSSVLEWMVTPRPASLSVYGSSKSSGPPPNEPTPLYPALSNQQTRAHAISAGFHNDGNTCYLRCYCNFVLHGLWTSLVCAVLLWLFCSARPPS